MCGVFGGVDPYRLAFPLRARLRMRASMVVAVLNVTPKTLLNLVGIDVMLAATTEHHCLQPFVHRHFAMLENRADLNGKRFPTVIALVSMRPGALALQLSYVFHATTVGTNRTVRPDAPFNKFICSFLVPKFPASISKHDIKFPDSILLVHICLVVPEFGLLFL